MFCSASRSICFQCATFISLYVCVDQHHAFPILHDGRCKFFFFFFFFFFLCFILSKWHNLMLSSGKAVRAHRTRSTAEKKCCTRISQKKTRRIEWWQICICCVPLNGERKRCTTDCIGKQLDVYLYAK